MNLVSHVTSVVCVILYISGGTYSLNRLRTIDFLRNFSCHVFLISEFLPEQVIEAIFFQISFSWRWLTGVLNQAPRSNKLIHYLLDYDDFHGVKLFDKIALLCSELEATHDTNVSIIPHTVSFQYYLYIPQLYSNGTKKRSKVSCASL